MIITITITSALARCLVRTFPRDDDSNRLATKPQVDAVTAREGSSRSVSSMTMVIENQNRQYGGMGFDHAYQNMHHSHPPHFTDPWAHTSSHSNPPAYATPSMGNNQMGLGVAKQDEVARPTTISLPYSSIPVSAPSLVANSTYSTAPYANSDMLNMQHDLPRSTFETAPSYPAAAPINGFTPANYPSMNYAQSLHSQQPEARRISHP